MIIVMWLLMGVALVWLLALAEQVVCAAGWLMLLPFRILLWMLRHPKSFLWLLALVLLAKILVH